MANSGESVWLSVALGAALAGGAAWYFSRGRSSRLPLPSKRLDGVYTPPLWIRRNSMYEGLLKSAPRTRLCLAHLPTPIHEWHVLEDKPGKRGRRVNVFIKRDDFTGSEFSGNKIRKLEFLLADALDRGFTSVVTVGGIQSNHCRATAASAARLGMHCHLILRTSNPEIDPGLQGNLLISRLCGAHIHLVSDDDYAAHPEGGLGLVNDLAKSLQAASEDDKPLYAFPSGGSCPIGVWGYLEACNELQKQLQEGVNGMDGNNLTSFDKIFFACGSGGTAAGLALGLFLSGMSISAGGKTELVGMCVDDSPAFFYEKIDALFEGMGVVLRDESNGGFLTAKDLIRLEDAVGLGYATAADTELAGISKIAKRTGVLLDPVYSGKAALAMVEELSNYSGPLTDTEENVLFIHTGGLFGMFDKLGQLQEKVVQGKGWQELQPRS